ncbi:4-diphosphocytidyl-2-C-methyl-D-erythritol kinase [hydrothermal vent metagenome]|uniref:4-(cytidine 5'-diphospho)-2-C-methyl-D-erythritol kinase n=1 Tax=hydrothermal vent metagenome TaxID=652676 RepID=A0A3B1CVP0_9ZZZZ
MKLSFKTPAKINLGLHISHKRKDGYHELETLLQMVSLFDSIELETRAHGIELECDTPGIPNDHSNLVVKAAQLLLDTLPPKNKPGVRIRLEKNIPSGAGLGGGSGNAAGVLMGLNVLWGLQLTRQKLALLGAKLGADVPFFLTAPTAFGQGRGDEMSPVQAVGKFDILLVYPNFPIATPWVYQNLNLKLTNPQNNISILKKFLSESQVGKLGEHLFNDLEPVVIERYPEIQSIKDDLFNLGAKGSLLSGSGSTVFAIFDDPECAKNAYVNYNKENRGVYLTKTVSCFSEFWPDEMLNDAECLN